MEIGLLPEGIPEYFRVADIGPPEAVARLVQITNDSDSWTIGAAAPAVSITQVLTSFEVATWPLLRASVSFFCVGSSVFSDWS